MFNIIAVGDAVVDTHVQLTNNAARVDANSSAAQLCFDYGKKIPIVNSFQSLGGNAVNVAIATAKLGLSSAVVNTVGQDYNGQMVIDELKKLNVDTSCINFDSKSKTRYSIILNYHGERTILSYSDKKNYTWPQPFPETEWIYYTGLSGGYEVIQQKLVSHLANHATIRLALNPGSYMLKYGLKDLREMLKRTDALIVNKEEAEIILGSTEEKEKSLTAIIHELLGKGAKEVVITDGVRGAWAANIDEMWHLDAFPVTVVAKTGAGDAFSAGYLTARQRGHDISHALSLGTANSSGVVMEHGPHAGLLDNAGIERMIKKYSKIQPEKLV